MTRNYVRRFREAGSLGAMLERFTKPTRACTRSLANVNRPAIRIPTFVSRIATSLLLLIFPILGVDGSAEQGTLGQCSDGSMFTIVLPGLRGRRFREAGSLGQCSDGSMFLCSVKPTRAGTRSLPTENLLAKRKQFRFVNSNSGWSAATIAPRR